MRSLLRLAFSLGLWAPALVLIAHQLVQILGVRAEADHPIHFAGGLAIAWVVDRTGRWMEWPHALVPLIAFLAGATVAGLWEIAEFASDSWLGSHIQHSIAETMLDLTFSIGGALVGGLISLAIGPRSRRV